MSAPEDSQLRIEPIDYHHEAAFLRSNHKVPDFDAWFGFTPSTDFNEFVLRMQCYAAGINLPAGHVPSTFMLALVGDKVVGRVSIRHVLNEQLFTLGGHIGYCVVPEERGKGYATRMLALALDYARSHLRVDRALLTCDESNKASRRVIEKNGGVLEDTRPVPGGGPRRMRFWIDLEGGGRGNGEGGQ